MDTDELIALVRQADREAASEQAREMHRLRRLEGKRSGAPPELPNEIRYRIYREREVEGRSLRAIATRLQSEGVPTARGGRWYASTVQAVLRSVQVDLELQEIRDA